MKKKVVYSIMIVGFFLLLTACSQQKESKTITFWNPLVGDDGTYMNSMVKAYNKTKPEYPIYAVVSSDMYTKIYSVMASKKDIPDLAIIHADRVPGFAKANMLDNMDNVMKWQPNIKKSNYIPQAWKAGTYKNVQYTVPLDIHSSAMYYNKDLLKKYGITHFLDDGVVTFDEMLSLQGKMKPGDFVVNNALLSWVILSNLVNYGGDIKDSKENPTLDTPEMKKTLESIKQLADEKLMTPNGEDGYLMFQSGHVLFSKDGIWTSTAHDKVKGLNYGVTNVYSPSPNKINNRGSSHMFALLKNKARTKEKEKGIAKFLEYIRNNSMEWAKAGQVVASKKVYEAPEFKKYPQSFFTSSKKELDSLHVFTYVYYPYVQKAIDTYCFDIVYNNISIDEGMKKMQQFVTDQVNAIK